MIYTIQGHPFDQNTYILNIDQKLVIIDPGYNYEEIKTFLKTKKPHLILLTHFHFDHVASTNQLCEEYGIKAFLDESEHEIVQKNTLASSLGFTPVSVYKKYLGNFKELKKILPSLKTFHAPGHSKGSTMFIFQNNLFSGDVIFKNAIGRTTFLYSDPNEMNRTLKRIKLLNKNYKVYPGHGPSSFLENILKLPIFTKVKD